MEEIKVEKEGKNIQKCRKQDGRAVGSISLLNQYELAIWL